MIEEDKNIQLEDKQEEKKSEIVSTGSLSGITKKINEEEDVDKVKDLTKLFNLAMLKKEINRAEKQSDMLDFALSEVYNRMMTGDMADKDLANYIKIFQDAINTTRKNTSEENMPIIQVNTGEININNDGLTREERENVINFIQNILTQAKSEDIIDVKSEERNTEDDD